MGLTFLDNDDDDDDDNGNGNDDEDTDDSNGYNYKACEGGTCISDHMKMMEIGGNRYDAIYVCTI